MTFSFSNILNILARVIGIAMTVFYAVFVFLSHGFSVDAFMESIVWLLVLGATLVAWKWRGWGAIFFFSLATAYIAISWPEYSLAAYAFTVLPLALTGLLLVISKYTK